MIIAQITDLHIKRKGKLLHHMINTARQLKKCITYLNRLDPLPDVVLLTGDLTESGKPKEYKRLRKLLDDLRIPFYLIPGNHDDRDNLREAFPDHRYLPPIGYLQYTIEQFPVRLIGLDTTQPGYSGGTLDDARLAWVDERLREQPSRPTLIFMHHPPFATGIAMIDALVFYGVERLGEIVARHPQIERIICGHIHRAMMTTWNGAVACTAASTASQLIIETRGKGGLGIALEPAGFSLHIFSPGAILTQHRIVAKGGTSSSHAAAALPLPVR